MSGQRVLREDHPHLRSVVAGGLEHRLLEWAGPGPTLLLLHGFLDCAGSFAPLVRSLHQDLHVVAMDFRGHGDSEWVGRGGHYHFHDYVRDVRDVVDSLQSERLFVLGHSMGGGVSLLFSGAWPAEVERLIVVEGLGPPAERVEDGPVRMRRWVAEERRIAESGPRLFDTKLAVARRLMARQPRLQEERALELAGWLARESKEGWQWRHDPMHRARGASIYQAATYAPFLQNISCPVLLVTGAESWYRWPDLAERRSHLPDWRSVEVAEAGHMIHQDQPDALGKAVARFLAGEDPEFAG